MNSAIEVWYLPVQNRIVLKKGLSVQFYEDTGIGYFLKLKPRKYGWIYLGEL